MKNFKNYSAKKYSAAEFEIIEDGIYRTRDPYDKDDVIYVTSLSFEHEPDMYEEEHGSPQQIAQVPFEDLLDEFEVYVTDFYDEINKSSKSICYQEFGSSHLENIKELRGIIGKRFYAVPYEEDGEDYNTVIE